MNRRGFLHGLFGGVSAAGLIIAAKPADIEAFAAPLVTHEPVVIDLPPTRATGFGEHLYNAQGECVAVVTGVDFIRDKIEVTMSPGDSNRVYVPGLPRIQIRAEAINGMDWDLANHPQFSLRGPKARTRA